RSDLGLPHPEHRSRGTQTVDIEPETFDQVSSLKLQEIPTPGGHRLPVVPLPDVGLKHVIGEHPRVAEPGKRRFGGRKGTLEETDRRLPVGLLERCRCDPLDRTRVTVGQYRSILTNRPACGGPQSVTARVQNDEQDGSGPSTPTPLPELAYVRDIRPPLGRCHHDLEAEIPSSEEEVSGFEDPLASAVRQLPRTRRGMIPQKVLRRPHSDVTNPDSKQSPLLFQKDRNDL